MLPEPESRPAHDPASGGLTGAVLFGQLTDVGRSTEHPAAGPDMGRCAVAYEIEGRSLVKKDLPQGGRQTRPLGAVFVSAAVDSVAA